MKFVGKKRLFPCHLLFNRWKTFGHGAIFLCWSAGWCPCAAYRIGEKDRLYLCGFFLPLSNQLMNNTTLRFERILPWLLLVVLALIWGTSFILMKKAMMVYTHTQVASLRICSAFLVMLPFIPKSFRQIPAGRRRYVSASGFLGNFFPAFLFTLAITRLDSSVTGVLNATTPMFTMLIGLVLFSTPVRKIQIFGLLLGLFGAIGLSVVKSNGGIGSLNMYVLLVVAATVMYGLNANLIKTYLTGIGAVPLTAWAMMVVAPPAFAYVLTTDFFERLTTHPDGWKAMGFVFILGAAGTALGVYLFNMLIKRTSAVMASSVTYLIPVVAVFWGVWDGERLFFMHYVGMALILTGVFLTNLRKN